MRIIAGRFRGKKLRGPRGTGLRPTSDRLREALFNILGPHLENLSFLDVFAGSGAVGIEAISRGALQVTFVESDRRACRLIEQNLELCKAQAGSRLLPLDAFRALRQLAREGRTFDIVFLDPPYDWQPYEDLLALVFGGGLVHANSIVVVEHRRGARLPETGAGFIFQRVVRQGDQRLSFYAGAALVASPCRRWTAG